MNDRDNKAKAAIVMAIEATIIVPTRNRASSLSRAIASIAGQDFPGDNYEILVVDNGSTDGTEGAVRAVADCFTDRRIRYVPEPVPGLLSGRHRGAAESAGELLLFVDDDIEAAPGWLAGIVSAFRDPAVHLVGGPCMPQFEIAPPRWMDSYWVHTAQRIECSALSLIYMGDAVKRVDPDYIWGLNYAIRKRTLFDAGGFHPDCIPKTLQQFQGNGESGLSMKIKEKGYAALYVPEARVTHRIPRTRLSVSHFEERFFYQGVCESYTQVRRHGTAGIGRLSDYPALSDNDVGDSAYGQYRRIIDRRFQKAHRSGFAFHQDAVARNDALLAWVTRKDYFDYRLPELSGEPGQPKTQGHVAASIHRNTTGPAETGDGAHHLRPIAETGMTPKIARQLQAFEESPREQRQSSAEHSQKPMDHLAYFEGLRERLVSGGIAVRDAVIDRADFDRWRSDFAEITRFYRPAGDVFIEKCLEHYLVFHHLGLSTRDRYIDVAAAESPWADALMHRGVDAYRMDLTYPAGINGMNIGADAGDTGLPEGFCTAMSLQCAFECFMGDADTRFVREAFRILTPGGRLAIAPLYLEDTHFITTSPLIDQDKVFIDPGARRVWREDGYVEPFSRMYSPAAFAERVWRTLPAGMDARVVFFTNLGELMTHYTGQRIYCFFMLLAETSATSRIGDHRCNL